MYEVTNAQYAEFLNAVAATDPYELYNEQMGALSYGGIIRSGPPGSYVYSIKPDAIGRGPNAVGDYAYANKPVALVNWYDAVRFVNWLNNGQGSGDTETGAYTLLGSSTIPTNGSSIVRNPEAKWFLPSHDEWYKAAFYDPASHAYFKYPTASDLPPDNSAQFGDPSNSANYEIAHVRTTGSPGYPHVDVDYFPSSQSPYGVVGMAGNVAEWTESLIAETNRVFLGGSWMFTQFEMGSNVVTHTNPELFNGTSIGFRVARLVFVPEPSGIGLCVIALASLLAAGRQRRSIARSRR
jgi:formylglycine-generating enzyme required for sulfatase activity